jgi:hypothetical protein
MTFAFGIHFLATASSALTPFQIVAVCVAMLAMIAVAASLIVLGHRETLQTRDMLDQWATKRGYRLIAHYPSPTAMPGELNCLIVVSTPEGKIREASAKLDLLRHGADAGRLEVEWKGERNIAAVERFV